MLEQMNGEMGGKVHMVKFNCNKGNKEMGKELGIKVAPTFHLYKKGQKVSGQLGAAFSPVQE